MRQLSCLIICVSVVMTSCDDRASYQPNSVKGTAASGEKVEQAGRRDIMQSVLIHDRAEVAAGLIRDPGNPGCTIQITNSDPQKLRSFEGALFFSREDRARVNSVKLQRRLHSVTVEGDRIEISGMSLEKGESVTVLVDFDRTPTAMYALVLEGRF